MNPSNLEYQLKRCRAPRYEYSYTRKNYGTPAATWRVMPTGANRANGVVATVNAWDYTAPARERARRAEQD